jgi:hypothetical protein
MSAIHTIIAVVNTVGIGVTHAQIVIVRYLAITIGVDGATKYTIRGIVISVVIH